MTRPVPYVMFGHNRMLGDLIQLVDLLGGVLTTVVQNVPEDPRSGSPDLAMRLARFHDPAWNPEGVNRGVCVDVIDLDAFEPTPGARYVVGFTGSKMEPLVRDVEERFGIRFETLVHPTALVTKTARLAPGCIVAAGAIVESGVSVGAHTIVNKLAVLGHDATIGDFCTFAPGVRVAGHAVVGRGASVGMGAVVLEDRQIGEEAVVAAGSVVTRDVDPYTMVAGVPAVEKKSLGRTGGDGADRPRIDAAVLECTALDDLSVDAIRTSIDRAGYAIVRGLATEAEVAVAVGRARAAFLPSDDHPTVGHAPADVRRNFQKWSVGTGGGGYRTEDAARLLRVIFTPFLDDDRYGVHDLLRRVAVVRNRLLQLPDAFAVDGIEDGFWTAARLQHYPRGGGFLDAHIDQETVDVLPSGAAGYVQVLMVLTERGRDFERGGAYLDRVDGRVDLEPHVRRGDLLIYDERTIHGVSDIDKHEVLDATTLRGRLTGFANLYRVL
ncbi:MAG TPA: hypothetical protein VFW06_03175 [Acidimicrobiia bacterium]|nr:hypothetical protein [Acidimicrobiia bacterium]